MIDGTMRAAPPTPRAPAGPGIGATLTDRRRPPLSSDHGVKTILRSAAARLVRARPLGKSPVNAYLRLNRRIWSHLTPSIMALTAARAYGAFLHRLVELRTARRQYFGTFFFRNRAQLRLVRKLAERRPVGSTFTMAFLGCSNGAELYSVLWTIRSARPDLRVISHAVDISEDILALAREGLYSLTSPGLVGEAIFARTTGEEAKAMFDAAAAGHQVRIKPWLQEGIAWHLGDAASEDILGLLGTHDMVLANNFLCHMDPPHAERCLRAIARLVAPGGHVVVSGVDLDVRTSVALDLRWIPVLDLMEDVHEGDPSLRNAWPWEYWGLEPLDKRRHDWRVRYASVFQLR